MTFATTQSIALGRFHRYPARYPGPVVELLFDTVEQQLGRRPERILDPFCGTGATMAAARQMGISSVGVELSHLGHLISTVRLHPPQDAGAALDRGLSLLDRAPLKSTNRVDPTLRSWIGEENSGQLARYLKELQSVTDLRERNWLTVAISDALRPASKWLPGSIKPQVDPTRTPPSLRDAAEKSLRRIFKDTLLEPETATPAKVVNGDARMLPISDNEFDAILTSPPYFTMYDYFDVQRLSYLAFGWPVNQTDQIGRGTSISPDGVGFRPPRAMVRWYSEFNREQNVLGRALRAYWRDMEAHLEEAHRVLLPGGVAVCAIANTRRSGKLFNIVDATAEIMERVGFEEISKKKRPQTGVRILPAGRDPRTGRFSSAGSAPLTEWILVARKPNS